MCGLWYEQHRKVGGNCQLDGKGNTHNTKCRVQIVLCFPRGHRVISTEATHRRVHSTAPRGSYLTVGLNFWTGLSTEQLRDGGLLIRSYPNNQSGSRSVPLFSAQRWPLSWTASESRGWSGVSTSVPSRLPRSTSEPWVRAAPKPSAFSPLNASSVFWSTVKILYLISSSLCLFVNQNYRCFTKIIFMTVRDLRFPSLLIFSIYLLEVHFHAFVFL